MQRQWVWPLLFSPLWGTLFVSFGLGPIFTRTDDPLVSAALALRCGCGWLGSRALRGMWLLGANPKLHPHTHT